MEKFDVLFTTDKKYIDIMMASMYSFLLNSKLENIRVHIITQDFSLEDYKRVEQITNLFNNIELYFYPLEKFDIDKYNIPKWRDGQIANSRLFFETILKPYMLDIKKLLYLDCDTITVSNLTELKNTDSLLMCKDICCLNKYYKNLYNLDSYYNSGVILIDVDEWINNGYQEKIIKFLENNKNIKLSYPDQDIINCALSKHINELLINYNLPPHAYMFNKNFSKLYFNEKRRNVSRNEVEEAKKDVKIIHSYGLSGIKPWHGNFNPFSEEFMKYILEINPNFKPGELDKMKKLVSKFPHLYRTMLLARTYMPEKIEDKVKVLALKCQHSKK